MGCGVNVLTGCSKGVLIECMSTFNSSKAGTLSYIAGQMVSSNNEWSTC